MSYFLTRVISITMLCLWASSSFAVEADVRFRLLNPEEQRLVNQLADATLLAFPQANREDAISAWILQFEAVSSPLAMSLEKTTADTMLRDFFGLKESNFTDRDAYLRAAGRIVSEEKGGFESAGRLKGAASKALHGRASAFYQARDKAYDNREKGSGTMAAEFERQGKTMEIIIFNNLLQKRSSQLRKLAFAMRAIRNHIPDRFPAVLEAKLRSYDGEIERLDEKVIENTNQIHALLQKRGPELKKLGLVPIEYSPQFYRFEVEVIPGGIGKHFQFNVVNEKIWECFEAVVN